jgi:predicted nucleic acid-binding protein
MGGGLLDTSVVIDWDMPEVAAAVPAVSAVSVVTFAELAAGPHLAASPVERARRQARLQQLESVFDPLPVDRNVARSYGQLVAAVAAAGRKDRRRMADLLIAATAHAHGLDLYTRNPEDTTGLDELLQVVAV